MNQLFRLLLIDDDEIDREAVVRTLRRGSVDYDVVQAATAADGLRLAADERFDAVLLDYLLPDQDGFEVLRTLRSGSFEATAIVMLSRLEDAAIALRCLDAGAQDFLLKDEVTGGRLSRAIRQAEQRHAIERELIKSRELLRALSEHDSLTGLKNRRGFETLLSVALAHAQRSNEPLAVMLLDLDDFKSINDTLGHDAGDAMLTVIAQRMASVMRQGDHLCRLGGDEFVVLMSNYECEDQVALVADRLLHSLREPIQVATIEKTLTASIGIATLNPTVGETVDLLKCADIAMYQAKQAGRDQCRFFSRELHDKVQLRVELKHHLERALAAHEFVVFYQPKFGAEDKRLAGMEALLRWQHPTRGLLAPDAFLGMAEDTGLIVDIGRWVLEESCRQLKDWQTRYCVEHLKLGVAVNLSAVQIAQASLPQTVARIVAETGVRPSDVELEITESVLIVESSDTVATLSAIAAMGIVLALDDFGTGYSSMVHLNQFPISILKIDKSFVRAIGGQDKGEKLLAAILAFAKTLEMTVVVEGIETQAQADFCIERGCDFLQGYLFSMPVSAAEFETLFLSKC